MFPFIFISGKRFSLKLDSISTADQLHPQEQWQSNRCNSQQRQEQQRYQPHSERFQRRPMRVERQLPRAAAQAVPSRQPALLP
jgi:hypothetical protein